MGAGQEGSSEGEAPGMGGNEASPESRSFDFERTTPVEVQPPRAATPNFTPAPAPVPAPEPRPEWTPAPPSDATREGPRSEP
jgi:hypothetical protein